MATLARRKKKTTVLKKKGLQLEKLNGLPKIQEYQLLSIVKASSSNDIRNQFIPQLDHFVCKLIRKLVLSQRQQPIKNTNSDSIRDKPSQSELLYELVLKNRNEIIERINEVQTFKNILHEYNGYYDKQDNNSSETVTPHIVDQKVQGADTLQEKEKEREDDDDDKEENGEDDDDGEVYCVCRKGSSGDMIACDDPGCKIEWYHYKCINMSKPPKGKWYCDACVVSKQKRESSRNKKNKR